MSNSAPYQASPIAVVVALILMAALLAGALALPRTALAGMRPTRALRPALIGLASFGLAVAWLAVLAAFAYGAFHVSPAIPLAFGAVWAAVTVLLVRRWTSGVDFGDRHRMALIYGALSGSWLVGFLAVGADPAIDVIAKVVLDVIALALLTFLASHVKRRPAPAPALEG